MTIVTDRFTDTATLAGYFHAECQRLREYRYQRRVVHGDPTIKDSVSRAKQLDDLIELSHLCITRCLDDHPRWRDD